MITFSLVVIDPTFTLDVDVDVMDVVDVDEDEDRARSFLVRCVHGSVVKPIRDTFGPNAQPRPIQLFDISPHNARKK